MGKFVVSKKVQDVNVLGFCFNELNLEQREQLKKELSEQLKTAQTQFIIDLSKIGFVSSMVVATIVFFSKEVRNNKGTVKLSGLSSEAFSIFKLTQLDKIFELYETERDALESFKRPL
ncbi:STAS domain-containing protein [Candidatus Omnitrophota bacterium]